MAWIPSNLISLQSLSHYIFSLLTFFFFFPIGYLMTPTVTDLSKFTLDMSPLFSKIPNFWFGFVQQVFVFAFPFAFVVFIVERDCLISRSTTTVRIEKAWFLWSFWKFLRIEVEKLWFVDLFRRLIHMRQRPDNRSDGIHRWIVFSCSACLLIPSHIWNNFWQLYFCEDFGILNRFPI